MWSSSISSESRDAAMFEEIGHRMLPDVLQTGGIILQDRQDGRMRLSIAVGDRFADRIKDRLDEVLADTIATFYKKRYLSESMRFPALSARCRNAYVQALVTFDRDFETELIKSELPECETLSIDGLFRFRCKELKSRWDEILQLASESAACLVNEDVCVELIRFLMSTSDYRSEQARVEWDGEESLCRIAFDGESETSVSEEEMCAVLVERSPSKVLFGVTCSQCPAYSLALRIFDDEVCQNG